MKHDNASDLYSNALANIDELIVENEKIFCNNFKRLEEINANLDIGSSNPVKRKIRSFMVRMFHFFFRPLVDRQNEVNTLLLNMIQDLKRMQVHMADRANLIAQNNKLGMDIVLPIYFMAKSPLYTQENREKCVIQIVSTLNFGDAVGNDVLAIKRALKESGYITAVFAEQIHEKIKDTDVLPLTFLPELREDDVVIYHFASADSYVSELAKLKCKKVLRYHNITPAVFFQGFDALAEMHVRQGVKDIQMLSNSIDYGLIVSEFNKKELLSMGYQCPMDVVPILIPFSDYEKEPDQNVLKKYNDKKTNILFVGRGAPNKKIEDVIRAFMAYKKTYDADARLFLVGNYDVKSKYYTFLQEVMEKENAKDIIFPGHISFAEILAYYRLADVFLCMSEHEGFCVPLVEAMFFKIPVIAYHSSAIPDTLNGTGVLIEKKDMMQIAEEIHKIVSDSEYAAHIIDGEQKRLQDFKYETIKEQIINFLKFYHLA